MINFYTGVPGSGKSLHLAQEIVDWLLKGKNVICVNISVDYEEIIRIANERKIKNVGNLICIPKDEFLNNSIKKDKKNINNEKSKIQYSYIFGLYGFAENFHELNEKGDFIEYQTLLAIDEADDFFDSRKWNRSDRSQWCEFFRMHRHYGFDVVLCSQTEKGIDKKIVALLQTKFEHRDYIKHKGFWHFVALIKGGHLFWCAEYNLTIKDKKESVKATYFLTHYKEYYNVYNSFSVEKHIDSAPRRILTDKERRDEYWNEITKAYR